MPVIDPNQPRSNLPRPEPRYFGPEERALFGWLHRAPDDVASRDVGVVICRPLGYEGLCSHRSMLHFAAAAAAAGFPALRFDYDGTGDSAGGAIGSHRREAWEASVEAAICELQRATGVTKVCLLGARIGAAIAARHALMRTDVVGLAVIAPVISGTAWLREVRALQATMGRPDPPSEMTLPEGATESLGVLLTAETQAAVKAIDLLTIDRAPAPHCLVLDRNDRPPSVAWCEHLERHGAQVTHRVLPGFVEMMLPPHEAVVPQAMVDEFRAWLVRHFDVTGEVDISPPSPTKTGPVAVAPEVEERAVFFDPSQTLFGIVTAPTDDQPERALIVLNSGAKHHVGNGGMWVTFARRLARRGWVVIRIDVSGIGDSLPQPGASENDVYTPNAIADLESTIRFARERLGAKHVEVTGLCSGAYHSLKGAAAGLPLDGITIINPLVFAWKPGMSLAYPPYQMVQAAAQYQRSVLQFKKWVDLVRGRVDLRTIAEVLVHRLLDRAQGLARDLGRMIGVAPSDDLGGELCRIVDRGVAVRFVFSAGDPGEALLRVGAGWVLPRLHRRGQLSVAYLPNCDHSLSSWWMRELLWAELVRGIGQE